MVLTSIRQAGSLKPQVKVRELRVRQAEIPPLSERWSLQIGSPYIRGVNLCEFTVGACSWDTCTKHTSSNVARGRASRPKITPRILYKVFPNHLSVPLAPQFFGFPPLFLKIFSPRPPGSVRRALNRRAAPAARPKTAEFRDETAHSRLAAAPILPLKHPARTLKNPPLTPLHIKKLSKVRSTLLTRPPRECILEYMRLKEPRRPPHTGRHAQHPRLQNFQTNPPRIRRSGALTPKE